MHVMHRKIKSNSIIASCRVENGGRILILDDTRYLHIQYGIIISNGVLVLAIPARMVWSRV